MKTHKWSLAFGTRYVPSLMWGGKICLDALGYSTGIIDKVLVKRKYYVVTIMSVGLNPLLWRETDL